MSIDLRVIYCLIDNSLLPINKCEIDRVLWKYLGEGARMIHEADSSLRIWSKRCRSATSVSELLEMSESKVDLWFLTDDDFSEGSLRLIPFECYDSYILEIQRLILWSKNNMDKGHSITSGWWWGEDEGKDINQEIDKALMARHIDIEDDYFDHYSILLYLSAVVKMLREAMSKKMSIVVDMSYM